MTRSRSRLRLPRGARPRPPTGIALTFASALAARVQRLHDAARRLIVDQWGQNAHVHGPRHASYRGDATASGWAEQRLRELAAHLRADDPRDVVTVVASRVVRRNGEEFKRLVPISLRRSPDMGKLLDGFRSDALKRIRALDSDAIDELRDILNDAEREAWRVDDLADVIEERLGVTASHAELLARDQVLSFNAAVTRERQTSSGIEKFVWSTSGDERVREEHAELDGEVFSWDDLPTVDGEDNVMPGDQFQCRCVAIPVLPDLDALEQTEAEDVAAFEVAAE